MKLHNLFLSILAAFALATFVTGCGCATKGQVDRVAGIVVQMADENDELVETHPRYQVTDDMSDEEREITEELKQAKLDANEQARETAEALQGEE